MPRPFVSNVTLKGREIILTVLLDEYLANKPVEISGYVTQNTGGFAIFYDTQSVHANPDGTVTMYVRATPSGEFRKGEPVTVTLRAASVWITVLAEGQDGQISSPVDPPKRAGGTPAQDGETWNSVQAVGYPHARGAEWASVGSDSSFRGR
jgi:hypothetical protein